MRRHGEAFPAHTYLTGRSCCDEPGARCHLPTRSDVATRKTERKPASALDPLVIEGVTPELDGGRYPVKRVVGDVVSIGADIIKDGHDLIAAHALYIGPTDTDWTVAPLRYDFD